MKLSDPLWVRARRRLILTPSLGQSSEAINSVLVFFRGGGAMGLRVVGLGFDILSLGFEVLRSRSLGFEVSSWNGVRLRGFARGKRQDCSTNDLDGPDDPGGPDTLTALTALDAFDCQPSRIWSPRPPHQAINSDEGG